MQPIDFVKALGVACATLVITVIASVLMVVFYSYFIEPGQSQEFYTQAAQWIAPWLSHLFGPLVFFTFNFWLARRSAERNEMLFAAATIISYVIVDLSTLPMMGLPIAAALTVPFGLSLCAKTVGAFAGAFLGSRARANVKGAVS